jgi:hypothetical protein
MQPKHNKGRRSSTNGQNRPQAAFFAAINSYLANRESEFSESAQKLLVRLANNPTSTKAFISLRLSSRSNEEAILATCIAADDLARSFSKRIRDAEKKVIRMERLGKAVATLREFVTEEAEGKNLPAIDDVLSVRIADDPPGSNKAMLAGLYWANDRIRTIQRVAKEDLLRFGATRKKGLAKDSNNHVKTSAAQNAAIVWLAQGVRRVTGKAHLKEVTDLAEVILRTSLTEERVRSASRNREKRDWRHPQ